MSEQVASAQDGLRRHVVTLYRETLGRCQVSCTVRGTDEQELDCAWSGSSWIGEAAARAAARTHAGEVTAWAVVHRGARYPTAGRRTGWSVVSHGGWTPLRRDGSYRGAGETAVQPVAESTRAVEAPGVGEQGR